MMMNKINQKQKVVLGAIGAAILTIGIISIFV